MATKGVSTPTVKPRRSHRPYLFRGLLLCGLCDCRMQGQWLREMAYYRCRFPNEYAIANKVAHPRNIYLREDQLVGPLDDWLLTALAPPHRIHDRGDVPASQDDQTLAPTIDPIQQILDECDRRIANYRALLDAGTDHALIAGWIAETSAERVQRSSPAPATAAPPSRSGSPELRSATSSLPWGIHAPRSAARTP